MDKTPLISIITITYNAAETLEPTLRSVAQQNFGDYEHLLIDGASTDDTLGVARRYEGLRIVSEPDSGLYNAMNKGLRLARGRYVLFLNAGDAFHSADVLKRYAERATLGDDIIYADTVIVDGQRHIIGARHLTAPQSLTVESFRKGMLVCHQAFMVKRELAPEYDESYRFSADYDWTVKCIKASDPEHNTNLGMIAIDYLAEGMTDKNKLKSLRERFRIMSKHYGRTRTIINHFGFLLRALRRRF